MPDIAPPIPDPHGILLVATGQFMDLGSSGDFGPEYRWVDDPVYPFARGSAQEIVTNQVKSGAYGRQMLSIVRQADESS